MARSQDLLLHPPLGEGHRVSDPVSRDAGDEARLVGEPAQKARDVREEDEGAGAEHSDWGGGIDRAGLQRDHFVVLEGEELLGEALDQAIEGTGTADRTGGQARYLDRRSLALVCMSSVRARLARMEAENAANPTPRRIILRLDGAFGSAGNVAWLYEQGYSVVARV